MNEKKDLRIVKTRKALFDALLELMKEKTFEEIKVSDICNLALVNRSTFYAHFDDKYDLLANCLDDLKQNLFSLLNVNDNDVNTKEYFMEMLKILINHIDEKKDIYLAILVNNRNGILMDIILDVANKAVNEKIKVGNNNIVSNIPTDVVSKFYLGAIIGICLYYLKSGNKYCKYDLIKYLEVLIPDEI